VSSMVKQHARVTAVASGKGGVGKTNVSVNLAVALGREGQKVLLVDCDMGLANAGILLGLNSSWTLADLLARHCELADLVQAGPDGVCFVPGHSGTGIGSALSEAQRGRLLAELKSQAGPFDRIILDTGSGIDPDKLGLVAAADQALVVLAPEPTSFMDAYALVKALAVGHSVEAITIVTNMVENDEAGAELFDHFRTVISRFLAVTLTHAGSVPDDPYVREAVFRKRSCVEAFPRSRASRAFTRLARNMSDAAAQMARAFAQLEPCHGAH
jgi:flagellar biosynthesis protein FlhG